MHPPTLFFLASKYGKVNKKDSILNLKQNYLLRLSEREEHDFIEEFMTWMKGSVVKYESLHIYSFGYERPLPLPSIALRPDSTLRFNLQTSGMQTPSRSSIVIIGEKYLGRFGEIMSVVDKIQENAMALPFAIFLQSEYEIKLENMSSHMHETPALVGIHTVVLTPRPLQ